MKVELQNQHLTTTTTIIILQQEEVLSELYHHIPPPSDKQHVQATLDYLEASSLVFEKGFLSHDRVMSLESEVFKNISLGFKFFSGWLDALLRKVSYYLLSSL